MNGFPWLTVAGAVPLLGAIVIALIPGLPADSAEADRQARNALAKWLALAFSLLTLVVVIIIAVKFQVGGPNYQFTEIYSWIPQFGVHYALGVDGIALVLIAMSAVLMPVVILASWHDAEPGRHSVKTYFALMMVLETMMIGVFAATDVFLFYVFFEAMLIPMYFMIGSYGIGKRQYAAVKFLLYSLLGGLLMLVAVIALYVYSTHSAATGYHGSFLFSELIHVSLSPTVQKWLFLGFFIAFAIKAPLWPFHTWLPDAAAASPPGAACCWSACWTRWARSACCGTASSCSRRREVLHAAGHHAVGDRDLVRGHRRDRPAAMKRLIAYTSVSHFGFIALGIFAMTSQGVSGATFYMVNHGFATGALFILAGFLIAGAARTGSPTTAACRRSPRARRAVPGLRPGRALAARPVHLRQRVPGAGRRLLPVQGARRHRHRGIILAAIYILWMYQRTMTGPVRDEVTGMPDLRPRELLAVVPLVVLLIGAGVYPKPVLDIINPAVQVTMAQVHMTDPEPAHPQPVIRRPQRRRESHRDGASPIRRPAPSPRRSIEYASSRRCWSSSARRWPASWSRRSCRVPSAAPRTWCSPSVPGRRVHPDHRGGLDGQPLRQGQPGARRREGAVAVDRPTLFIQGTILVLAFVSVLLIGDTSNSPFAAQAAATPGSPEEREGLAAGIMHTEIFPLTLFAVGGMMLFPASNDLLTMFVALEVLSLPLYLLCGLARRRRLLSHEAAMKYFLLGAFSSAFFLFGIAMLYGFSGSVWLSGIAAAASRTPPTTLLFAGIALTGIGLLFKIGACRSRAGNPTSTRERRRR